jgi:hypothetical protein
MREGMANGLMLGLAIAFLWHFAMIVRYGQVLIQEPSPVVLWLEVVLLLGVAAFGIYNVIRVGRRGNGR